MSYGLELRKFVVPEFIFGVGASNLAGRYARNLGARKVLVVTDQGVIEAGWTKQVTDSLEAENLRYVVFSNVTPNPRAQEVMAGAAIYQTEGCNVIVVVGGGSPMDCAKGIGIVSSNKRHILEFEGVDQVPMPGPPLICIPTTAGSSADVSQFAIITDTDRQVKIAIISKAMVPDAALIDPVTTTTMSPYLTACTGIDALTHAIEAFVSNAHSPITDLHALEAVRLISANLLTILVESTNIELRSQMMLGSLHAGLAFSNASLGAVHAIAHSLGGFLDCPHGEANSLLLEHVVAFNFEAAADRYLEIGRAMGLGWQPGQGKSAILAGITQLREVAGIEQSLSQKGLCRSDIAKLAEKAMQDPCMVTNPRRPTQTEIEAIYEAAF
jgi:alcohol dehydrogenase class IV